MSEQLQLDIPGMPPPSPKPKKLSAQQRIVNLENRVLQIEVDVILLRIGDKDYA